MLCTSAQVALQKGWDTFQPIGAPDFDLATRYGREDARKYLYDLHPDLVVLTSPCALLPDTYRMNQRTPHQVQDLRRRRQEQQQLLAFMDEVMQWQLMRGRAAIVGNPARSLVWDQPPMQAARTHPGVRQVTTDVCCYTKGRPDNGRHIQRPTTILGTPEICSHVNRKCKGYHVHDTIEDLTRGTS